MGQLGQDDFLHGQCDGSGAAGDAEDDAIIVTATIKRSIAIQAKR